MTGTRLVVFAVAAAALVGLIVYAGAGAVGQALAALGWSGFALISLLRLPVLVLLGMGWWIIGRDMTGASPWKFISARYVRDSAAEALPFSQVGGFVIGARFLTLLGPSGVPVSVSMLVDLVIELAGKLPYVLVGLLMLLELAPRSGLLGPVSMGLGVAALGLAALGLFRKRIESGLARAATALGARWPKLGLAQASEMSSVFDRVFAQERKIAADFGLHVVCWTFGAVDTWVIFHLMGVPVGLLEALVIDSLVCGLRTFGFAVPAAMAVQEAGYVLVCGLFGIDPALAVAFSLARRAREIAISIPGLAGWQVLEGRRISAAVGVRNPIPGP